ncbi:MAG: hypothetical protein RL582_164 [Bacteroidota bacterium]|jgi:hypothetical protein
MFNKIKKAIVETLVSYKKIDLIHNRELNDYKHSRINLGQIQSRLNNDKKEVKSVNEVEFQVFSQFGDDGIIQFLIGHLPIKNKTFIEFGVENYKEANTRFLLVNNYWSGFVIDGSPENVKQIVNDNISGYFDLRSTCSFITKENINELMSSVGFNPEVGLLSIDIDGNDYWVWNEMNVLHPDIIISEYNALFGFEDQITIPYKPDFVRGKSSPFSLYGSSLAALVQLAKKKGYFYIGSNSAGNNAYFINEKHRNHCIFPEISAKQGYRFSSFSESRDSVGIRNRGKEKIMAINNAEVYDIVADKAIRFDAEKVIASLLSNDKFKGIH